MSAATSIAPRASPRPAMAGRCSSRPPRPLSSSSSSPTSASTASRISALPSGSTSSATASSRRSSRSTGRTCRFLRPRSSAANESWSRWSVSSTARVCSPSRAPAAWGRPASRPRPPASPPTDTRTVSGGSRSLPLRDPALVLETAAQVVGSKNGLAENIADKAMLLLFDNFEQVVEAAADLASLLASCPNLDLLVTSREPLHVTGEQEYQVPPLAHEEGVGFFLARARAVEPDFQADEAVPEICRRLDDLPLALELAAARVKALSSTQILERLEQRLPLLTGGARDLPERQRTLRATIEWSHELLDARGAAALLAARRLPRRLHARGGRGGRGGRTRHASFARRQEPRSPHGRSLLDARDDPRVRR